MVEADKHVESIVFKGEKKRFASWIEGFKSTHIDKAPNGIESQASYLCNTSGILEIFKRIAEDFTAMFRRKKHLFWYTTEGVDEMEFTEAESNLNDLTWEYIGTSGACYTEDEEEPEEE